MRVRAMTDADVRAAVRLHVDVLPMEFLTRFGERFLRTYYRAWLAVPGGLALVAEDDGRVVGALLGATGPAEHTRAMVRRDGWRLARDIGLALVRDWPLARDLLVTRARRYAGGLYRLARRRSAAAPAAPAGPVVGEVTHVLVDAAQQGHGIGRALVAEAIAQARAAGDEQLVLVTPPDLAAQHFYDRLGWRRDGEITSRSGEVFLRYRYDVR
jgi:ribosomal protein S18 acetylase RimI-like enzyme